MVVGALVAQRTTKMTFPMLDHLRILNEVFAGGFFVFFVSAFLVCFRFMSFSPAPVIAHHSA